MTPTPRVTSIGIADGIGGGRGRGWGLGVGVGGGVGREMGDGRWEMGDAHRARHVAMVHSHRSVSAFVIVLPGLAATARFRP